MSSRKTEHMVFLAPLGGDLPLMICYGVPIFIVFRTFDLFDVEFAVGSAEFSLHFVFSAIMLFTLAFELWLAVLIEDDNTTNMYCNVSFSIGGTLLFATSEFFYHQTFLLIVLANALDTGFSYAITKKASIRDWMFTNSN